MNSRFSFVASPFLLVLLLHMSIYKNVGASEKAGVAELPQLPQKQLQDIRSGWSRKLLGQVENGGIRNNDPETVPGEIEHQTEDCESLRHERIRNLLGRGAVSGGVNGGGRPSSATGGGNSTLRPDNTKKNGAVSTSVPTPFLLVALVVASFAALPLLS